MLGKIEGKEEKGMTEDENAMNTSSTIGSAGLYDPEQLTWQPGPVSDPSLVLDPIQN